MRTIKILMLLISAAWSMAPVDFDGNDDYIACGTMGNLGQELDDYVITVSAWIQPNGTSLAAICGFERTGVDTKFEVVYNCEPGYGTAAGKIMAYMRDEENRKTRGGVDTDLDLDDGDWHHILFEIDGGGGDIPYIYVDGVSQTVTMDQTTSLTNPVNFDSDFYVGAENDGGSDHEFFGQIKELYIFRGALTEAEKLTLAKSADAGVGLDFDNYLYAYWSLSDQPDGSSGDGATFIDFSGNGNDGTGEDTGGAGLTCYGEDTL